MTESDNKEPAEVKPEDSVFEADQTASDDRGGDQSETGTRANGMPTNGRDQLPPRGGRRVAAFVAAGVVTAAIGFGAGYAVDKTDWLFAQGPSETDVLETRLGEVRSMIEAKSTEIAQLKRTLADLTASDDLAGFEVRLGELETRLSGLDAKLTKLAQRVAELENRPLPEGGSTAEAVAAYERQLAAMREMFSAELEKIRQEQKAALIKQKSALQTEQRTALSAAIAELRAAVEAGEPYSAQLAAARKLGAVIPEALEKHADAGVTPLSGLQGEFAGLARLALNASIKAEAEAGKISRLDAFLRTQLGARSLEPRPGNDPDAILSRAEAAVKAGDLERAIAEISTLPQAGQAVFGDWLAKAKTRLVVQNAVNSLTASVGK